MITEFVDKLSFVWHGIFVFVLLFGVLLTSIGTLWMTKKVDPETIGNLDAVGIVVLMWLGSGLTFLSAFLIILMKGL